MFLSKTTLEQEWLQGIAIREPLYGGEPAAGRSLFPLFQLSRIGIAGPSISGFVTGLSLFT